jgi:peptidoglycan-N-acetylglucosamine deacetylase
LHRVSILRATILLFTSIVTLQGCFNASNEAQQASPYVSPLEALEVPQQQSETPIASLSKTKQAPSSETERGSSPIAQAPSEPSTNTEPVPTQSDAAAPPVASSNPEPAAKQQPEPVKPKTKTAAKKKEAPASAAQQQISAKKLTLSQLVKKYPDLLLLKGSPQSKQVALTFDDAPDDKFTAKVLDTLKQHHIKATFFLVGSQAEKYPEMVKRIVNEGHVIGNHTHNHKLLTKMSDEAFQEQITKTESILQSLCGYKPKLMRPPYGEISEAQLLWASEQGFRVINWNVDSQDWRQLSDTEVASNILKSAKAGSIVLQHSGGGPGQDLSGTVQALPEVITTLQSRGYKLVTLPELLHISKQM